MRHKKSNKHRIVRRRLVTGGMLAIAGLILSASLYLMMTEQEHAGPGTGDDMPDQVRSEAHRSYTKAGQQIPPRQISWRCRRAALFCHADDPDSQEGTRKGLPEEMPADPDEAALYFYSSGITEEIRARITGISYPDPDDQAQISYEELAYVHVLHYGFDGQVHQGELICNRAIAQDLVEIFGELFAARYPIEKIRLIDEYGGDDEASMRDNNTSCFNYRTVPGKTKLSNHSYGRAIDINPLYNPYVRTVDGAQVISPDNAGAYADRSEDIPYKIDEQDLCFQLFIQHGFTWGGSWNSVKDYQHFEKK